LTFFTYLFPVSFSRFARSPKSWASFQIPVPEGALLEYYIFPKLSRGNCNLFSTIRKIATLASPPQYFLIMPIHKINLIHFTMHSLHFAEYLLQ
jgi:hypothetical protein